MTSRDQNLTQPGALQKTRKDSFYYRMGIALEIDKAKEQFINRCDNFIGKTILTGIDDSTQEKICAAIADEIGVLEEDIEDWWGCDHEDFYQTLQCIEVLYSVLPKPLKTILDEGVSRALRKSPMDLGITWERGRFARAGAVLLDDKLVNDVLQWLDDPQYSSVRVPFEKGLSEFLRARSEPERFENTIKSMYEALEAMAAIVLKPTLYVVRTLILRDGERTLGLDVVEEKGPGEFAGPLV